jgi:hypothetical protein
LRFRIRIATEFSTRSATLWDANLLLDGKVLVAGGKISVRFKNDAKSETWDFNLVDDEGLSLTLDKIRLAGVDTVTLKDGNGTITAEIE